MNSGCGMNSEFNNNALNNYNTVSASSYNSYNGLYGGGYNSVNYNNTNMNYANSYVPNQVFGRIFSPAEGLENGTMFPDLVSLYYPNQSLQERNFLRYNNGGGCCR
jgi:hypothetical protein